MRARPFRPLRVLRRLCALRRNARGVAAVEFALVSPLFLLATMGLFDLTHQYYARSVLEGVVEQAARDATLEGFAKDQTKLDNFVKSQVQSVWRDADLKFKREAFDSFGGVGRAEDFTDANGNGKYDKGECFIDANGNGMWDENRARTGNGGAEDVIAYTTEMRLMRIFPLWRMLGQPQNKSISVTTILRNQPYSAGTGKGAMICG